MRRKVIILGITGSVGESALKVLRKFPDEFELVAFSYHKNHHLASQIAQEFSVKKIACTSGEGKSFWSNEVTLYDFMEDLFDEEFDCLLNAVVGAVGVNATRKALEMGKKVLLANKESLVMAGELLSNYTKKKMIIPVDSEHNSLFRLLENTKSYRKLILTASGGPFRQTEKEKIAKAKIKDVLRHPTWEMGAKITVDSATMVNKALEVMEAHFLFQVPYEKISAIIHPQSYVHAALELSDGTYFFHASEPDMVYPIAHALFYPEEPPLIREQKNMSVYPSFEFYPIEKERYPGFFLGIMAAQKGGLFPAIFNAANEEAVSLFLSEKIRFFDIPELIEKTLASVSFNKSELTWDILWEADKWAREKTRSFVLK